MAGWVDDLVTGCGITEPLNLVVHDIGGPYGLAWAIRYPDKVKRMVVMNTVFFSDYQWHFFGKLWRTPVLGELVQLLTNRRVFAQELRRGSRLLRTDQINRAYDGITPVMKKMVLRLYRALDPVRFKGWEERLRELVAARPTLVLWGDQDPYVSSTFAERFGAPTVVHLPDCGHWVPAEQPEQVSRILLQFLDDAEPCAIRPRRAATAPCA